MQIASSVLITYLFPLITLIAGLLFYAGHRDLGLWSSCVAAIVLVIALSCYIQDSMWKSDSAPESPLMLTQSAIDQLLLVVKTENKSAENKRLVESLHRDFDKIHVAYVKTFEKYRDSIEHSKAVLDLKHPVFEQIKKDSLYTASERIKLLHAPTPENAGTYPDLLREYFATGINVISVDNPDPNIPQLESWTPTDPNFDRLSLYQALGAVFGSNEVDRHKKLVRALEEIDKIIEHLQDKYRIIHKEFQRIYPTLGRRGGESDTTQ